MKDYLKLLLTVIVSLIAGAFMHKCQSTPGDNPGGTESKTDTLKVYDTTAYHSPRPQAELATGTREYKLPTRGLAEGINTLAEARGPDKKGADGWEITEGRGPEKTTGTGDSAIVELPIIQRHYADSTYEAWISGPVDPRLDSLRVIARTTIITKREWKPPKRWHLGITAGYGYGLKGFQPYIGVGITYSIFSF